MLDGIVVNMIHTPGTIGVISELMLPEAPLPQGKPPASYAGLPIGLPTADAGRLEMWRLSKLNRVE